MTFWKGLIAGPDGQASMTKALAWMAFLLIVASWFKFPARSIGELLALFAFILSGRTIDKLGWHKWGMKNLPETGEGGEV